jgi:probable DNA repair protein
MDSQFFRAVEQSATVLTASNRLSRSLIDGYNQYQRGKGRSVWKTPRIFQLDAWLEQCCRDTPVLLNEVQEAALWESIILESPAGRSLLRIPETAEQAMKAWALLHAYRLPFERAAFSVSEDCEAFYAWACEFVERRDAHGWMEKARVADFVAERPPNVILAGFDEVTPQQAELFNALGASLHRSSDGTGSPRAVAYRDMNDEIARAASWARSRLKGSVGIIVPNIGAVRSKLERAFAELLPGAFHISLGPALRERPIVHAALLLLELAGGDVPLERMGMILRNPYWKGGEEERSRRAMLDAHLRKQGRSPAPLAEIRAFSSLEKEIRRLPVEQSPSQWSRTFSRLLKHIGWPGDRALNSEEHQAREAWNKLLSAFATLDAVVVSLNFGAALVRLNNLAAKPFQLENEGAPVQIMGLLEASGLHFDHLWVLGLHDEEVPPPPRPNPFLPLTLQRDRGLPHSSAQRELEFYRKLLSRLSASAAEVVFSYPQWEGDQPRTPSPLIGLAAANEFEPFPPRWLDLIRASAASETLEDRVAPELPVGWEQRGGTGMLKDMAACPFRAFAQQRLGARELEDANLGLNAKEKGSGVHKVLELIWAELKNQENLRALEPQQLQDLIATNIEVGLEFNGRLGAQLERRRLQRLLTEWFEIEKQRPPFRVLEREQDGSIDIAGLRIKTRIDRVDELPDGRRVIIDYKTGEVKNQVWSGERLGEPQVPLYCVSSESPIAAAAFAQIRAGDLQIRGVSTNGELGKIKAMDKLPPMPELIEEWKHSLQKLGHAFRAGVADVDPKDKSTCDYCRLPALCRIHDAHD